MDSNDSEQNLISKFKKVFILLTYVWFLVNISFICYEINTGFEIKTYGTDVFPLLVYIVLTFINSGILGLFLSFFIIKVILHLDSKYPDIVGCFFVHLAAICFFFIFIINNAFDKNIDFRIQIHCFQVILIQIGLLTVYILLDKRLNE